MKSITIEELKAKLKTLGGALKTGKHSAASGECCALELVCAVRECSPKGDLSDDPNTVGLPDFRQLNDGKWESDEKRTEHMLPVLAAFSNYTEWVDERKARAFNIFLPGFVREVLPVYLHALKMGKLAAECGAVTDVDSARKALESLALALALALARAHDLALALAIARAHALALARALALDLALDLARALALAHALDLDLDLAREKILETTCKVLFDSADGSKESKS